MQYAYSKVFHYQAYVVQKHKNMEFSYQMIMMRHTLDSPLPPPETNTEKDHWMTLHSLLVWMATFSLTTCMVGMTISSRFLCLFAAESRQIKFIMFTKIQPFKINKYIYIYIKKKSVSTH